MNEFETNVVAADGEEMIDLEQITDQITALLITREGTMPGNRNFGLSGDFLDKPPQQAVNIMMVELMEKMAIFMPGIVIQNIKWEEGDEPGLFFITITVGRSEES